jgi:Holliday junction resolvasome RuvABC DNA-binding subunit
MLSLGYTAAEAQRAVARAMDGGENLTSEAIILRALKRVSA